MRSNYAVSLMLISGLVALPVMITSSQAATFTYLTDFTKDVNAQTNAFPGYPSGMFTANNSYGTTFDITADSNGNNYYDFHNDSTSAPLVISTNLSNVTHVYTLINAYHPYAGTVGQIEFRGSGGADEVFTLSADSTATGGADVRDFYQGQYNNTLNAPNAQNAYIGNGQGGAGTGNVQTGSTGNYVLDEQDFQLSSAFAMQNLVSITLSPTPNSGGGVPILFGVTAQSGVVSNVPLPASAPLFGAALAALGVVSFGVRRKAKAGTTA